jgi:hypothetical protein
VDVIGDNIDGNPNPTGNPSELVYDYSYKYSISNGNSNSINNSRESSLVHPSLSITNLTNTANPVS